MNNRIKEIAEQAEQYALDKANENNDEEFEYSFDDDFKEKFSELIVREVFTKIEDNGFEIYQPVKESVMKHFGVYEE